MPSLCQKWINLSRAFVLRVLSAVGRRFRGRAQAVPAIFWVRAVEPLRIALMPRPRAGDWLAHEVSGWRSAGVETVVSLLESSEIDELALSDEPRECQARDIEFISFPIPDYGVPSSLRDARVLAERLSARVRSGKAVAIHCRAGIGRSGLVAACVLLDLGIPLTEVFPMLIRARGLPVPATSGQVEWVVAYARAWAGDAGGDRAAAQVPLKSQ